MNDKQKYRSMSEPELQLCIRNGDDAAIEYVYYNNISMIRSLVIKYNNKVDHSDIFQEAMMVLLNKIYDSDLTCKISTFLYSVSRNLVLKEIRDNSKMEVVEEVDTRDSIEAYNTYDERKEKVLGCLAQLGHKCRQILELFYLKSMRMEDIALRLGYTNSANAKNQKYKCMKQLKTLVYDE